MPDDLAAILEEFRQGERAAPRTAMRCLLAAIEAVLKQHQPINSDGTMLCDKCSFAFRTPWPCGEVDAITAALTGDT